MPTYSQRGNWGPGVIGLGQELRQVGGMYRAAAGQAAGAAAGAALSRGTNPFLASRQGARAAGDASARLLGQGAQAQQQVLARRVAEEAALQEERRNAANRTIGSILGGAGQVVGMLAPALGPLAPAASLGGAAAGGIGGAIGGGGAGAAGGIGQAIGGLAAQRPAAPAPGQPGGTAATLGMVDRALATPGPGSAIGGSYYPTEEEWRRQSALRRAAPPMPYYMLER